MPMTAHALAPGCRRIGAVLDARDVERAVVAGHSWGGHLALHLAVSHSGQRPEPRIIPAAGHLPWIEAPGCAASALARIRERLAARNLPTG